VTGAAVADWEALGEASMDGSAVAEDTAVAEGKAVDVGTAVAAGAADCEVLASGFVPQPARATASATSSPNVRRGGGRRIEFPAAPRSAPMLRVYFGPGS
jgi:hypothetical protein